MGTPTNFLESLRMLTIVALVAIAIASVNAGYVYPGDKDAGPVQCSDSSSDEGMGCCRNVPCTISYDGDAVVVDDGSYRKREVEQTTRKVKVTVGFKYSRNAHSIDTRSTCGPEVRLLVNDQPIAHTEADPSAEDLPYFPQEGEGSFDVKVSLPENSVLDLVYRDGPGCDIFDDDDDAESTSDGAFRQAGKKRSVESSSSSDDDDGTTVSLSKLREAARIELELGDVITVELDESSSSSSSDDDDDEDRKRALNYFA